MLIVPARMMTPTTGQRERDLVADDLGRRAQAARSEYLLKLDQPPSAGRRRSARPSRRSKEADVEILADQARRERMTRRVMTLAI